MSLSLWQQRHYDLVDSDRKGFQVSNKNIDNLYHISELRSLDFISARRQGLNRKGFRYFQSNGIKIERIYSKRLSWLPNHTYKTNIYDFIGIRIINDEDNLIFKLFSL